VDSYEILGIRNLWTREKLIKFRKFKIRVEVMVRVTISAPAARR